MIVPVQIAKSFLFPFNSGVPISIAPIWRVGVGVGVCLGVSAAQAKVVIAKMETMSQRRFVSNSASNRSSHGTHPVVSYGSPFTSNQRNKKDLVPVRPTSSITKRKIVKHVKQQDHRHHFPRISSVQANLVYQIQFLMIINALLIAYTWIMAGLPALEIVVHL